MKDAIMRMARLLLESHRSERGQALVLMVLGFVALVGMTALTIDVGYGYSSRAKAQSGADSAGYAAAIAHLLEGADNNTAIQAALDAAAANGYIDSNPETEVIVNIPPLSGPHAGDDFFVEVIIKHQEDTYFASALGVDLWDIAARSVATADTTPKPYSIITLNSNQCKATEVDGSVVINIDGAGTFTQSNCATDAFYTEGSINVDTADNDVVGGWVTGGSVSPTPSKAYPIIDPLAGVEPPTPPSSPVHPCPVMTGGMTSVTLQPGVYECEIDPPGNVGLVFEPGNYYLKGGLIADGGGAITFGAGEYTVAGSGVRITGSGSVTGNELTFFIEEGSAVFTGTGTTELTAPTSGPYEGILVYQYHGNTNTVFITGNAAQDGWGTVYARDAEVDFSGNARTSFQFISDTFYAHGNSDIDIVFRDNKMAEVPYIWIAE